MLEFSPIVGCLSGNPPSLQHILMSSPLQFHEFRVIYHQIMKQNLIKYFDLNTASIMGFVDHVLAPVGIDLEEVTFNAEFGCARACENWDVSLGIIFMCSGYFSMVWSSRRSRI